VTPVNSDLIPFNIPPLCCWSLAFAWLNNGYYNLVDVRLFDTIEFSVCKDNSYCYPVIRRLHGMNNIGLFSSLIIIVMIPVALADNINPGVFAVDSKPYGLSFAQWTGNWWKWAKEIPNPNNPIADKTGANCAQQ
jgi:hypothetical protein